MDDNTTRKRRPRRQPAAAPEPKSDAEDLGDIATGLITDLQNIVRGEVQLAKTELKQDVSTIGKAAGMLVAGAMLGWAGFLFLMGAAAFLLDDLIEEMWASAGIVAVALLIIAAIVTMAGRRQLSKANLKPEQTIQSVKEDKEWASRQINSVRK